jgi:hypothetical protein
MRGDHHVPPDGAVLPREFLDHVHDGLVLSLGAAKRSRYCERIETGVAQRLEHGVRHVALLVAGVAPVRNDWRQGARPLDPLAPLYGCICRHGHRSFLL